MELDSKIWKNLPTELIKKIIEDSSPSIDTQLEFKIKPMKLDENRIWRIWYLLKSHDGIIYNLETKTLHNFRIPGSHIIRRPIELDWIYLDVTSFNQRLDDHMLELTTETGVFIGLPSKESWVTDMRVLLKGSGLARIINSSI